jgi:CBS domain-containing protein
MRIQEVSTPNVKACSPDTDLAAAAKIMWDDDCGAVPVVNDERRVVGMITDRDICIAAATRAASPANIRVHEVMSAQVHTCHPQDDVRSALKIMREQRIRRIPVVDERLRLTGILSLNDLVAHAGCRKDADIQGDEFIDTMKAICAHRREAVAV